jgi:hypothetical protein
MGIAAAISFTVPLAFAEPLEELPDVTIHFPAADEAREDGDVSFVLLSVAKFETKATARVFEIAGHLRQDGVLFRPDGMEARINAEHFDRDVVLYGLPEGVYDVSWRAYREDGTPYEFTHTKLFGVGGLTEEEKLILEGRVNYFVLDSNGEICLD